MSAPSNRQFAIALGLLWLAGNALRLPILAVPPVVNTVQADLAMSGTEVGILSGLPVVLFALAAVPGALLIARIGAVPALLVGLVVAAIGTSLRGGVDSAATLFAATAIMGAGIAVMQPALPAIVRQWTPMRIGLATAVFTNGLIVGEIIPVAAMIPAVLPLTGGSWRWALAFWALPLLAIAVVIAVMQPRGVSSAAKAPATWWPQWRHPHVWAPGLILGSANAAYFGGNTFLPGYLRGAGRPDLIPDALTALNLGQLPVSLLLLVLASRFERRAWPFIALTLGSVLSITGIVSTASGWTIAFAAVLGFCAAGVLALSLTLPPLLRPPAEIAPTSAAMFAIGYTVAMAGSVLGGAAWDMMGAPGFAFLPIAAALLAAAMLPASIDYRRPAEGGA